MPDDHQPIGAGGSLCPVAEKKAKEAECRRRHRAKLKAAGLCRQGCGSARDEGSRCRPCKDKMRAKDAERWSRPGGCYRCGKVWAGKTKRCPDCLESCRKYYQKNQFIKGKRWLRNTNSATGHVGKGNNGKGDNGKGKCLTSKHFTWTHFDFVARFPLYGQGKSCLVIDHIIPRAAAVRADNIVDEAFGALVLELENIQLLTSQQNNFKRSNLDARCMARAIDLRAQGMEGASLFHKLNAEFRAEGLAAQDIKPVQMGGAA